MKKAVTAFFMSWGMFLAIPCPLRRWDNALRPLSIVFLPLVGLIVGGVWALAAVLLRLLGQVNLFGAAVLAILPCLISGGIHMDGFMDTCDAVFSRRDIEERLRILKDVHTGSFAVIAFGFQLLLLFALFASGDWAGRFWGLLFIPVVTRACAGAAVSILRPLGHSKYAGAYGEGVRAAHVTALALTLAFGAAIPVAILGLPGLCCAAGALGSGLALWYAHGQLGGVSGDIAGFSIVAGELAAVGFLMLF